jgi:hypothetical protein
MTMKNDKQQLRQYKIITKLLLVSASLLILYTVLYKTKKYNLQKHNIKFQYRI